MKQMYATDESLQMFFLFNLLTNYIIYNWFIRYVPTYRTELLTEKSVGRSESIRSNFLEPFI